MAIDMQGKVAVVTGSAQGIGKESALRFAAGGAAVVVADISVDGGNETVAEIQKAGGDAAFVHTDVTRSTDVAGMVAFCVERYGRLDYAHNNAGGPLITRRSIVEATEEDWDRVVEFNLKSAFLCIKFELIHMIEHGGGSIVNTSSAAAYRGGASSPAYVSAKHGLVGLTKAAALESAKLNVRVNSVCPGATLTPAALHFGKGAEALEERVKAGSPMGRVLSPTEIAEAAYWLCSDASSGITGVSLPVDGGGSAM